MLWKERSFVCIIYTLEFVPVTITRQDVIVFFKCLIFKMLPKLKQEFLPALCHNREPMSGGRVGVGIQSQSYPK